MSNVETQETIQDQFSKMDEMIRTAKDIQTTNYNAVEAYLGETVKRIKEISELAFNYGTEYAKLSRDIATKMEETMKSEDVSAEKILATASTEDLNKVLKMKEEFIGNISKKNHDAFMGYVKFISSWNTKNFEFSQDLAKRIWA